MPYNQYNINMENVKNLLEKRELENLSQFACLSSQSKGREFAVNDCNIRTSFQRDRDRIIHCKAFRRLKHKTQVFLSPEGDHYRTRLTHTLEVAQIGRTIARALRLNEDLVEAIALGHDLGHTPFGHAGEATLNNLVEGGFAHNEQSRRVVELLEDNGKGLNLTYEVRDGIANHKYKGTPSTLEGELIKFADRFAYINHDIEDATRAGIISEHDLPKDCTSLLGNSKGERINKLIVDVINTSYDKPYVRQSDEYKAMTEKLHAFMFEAVYFNDKAKHEEVKAKELLAMVYNYYLTHLEELPEFFKSMLNNYPKDRVVCDYVSSFTDRYCISVFEKLFIPSQWNIL